MPAIRQFRQLKRVCFTLNNYTAEDEERIQGNTESFSYCVYGRETAPTTGTIHLQGFINFKSKRSFDVIRTLVGIGGHIEPARGTDSQNKEYCSKSGDFWEYGVLSGQGHRSDLDACVQSIRGGATVADICSDHTGAFIKYFRGIERAIGILKLSKPIVRDFKTECKLAGLMLLLY